MNRPIGVDVSYYEVMWGQPLTGKYWKPELAKKPIDFVIQRSSYGLTKDTCFDFLYEKSTSQIPVKGFYHYFSSWSSYIKQMDVMLKVIGNKDYQFLAVDYETYGNTLDGRTFAEVCEMVKQLGQKTGKKILFYFNPNVYNVYMKPYGADLVIKNWNIWLAMYPRLTSIDTYVFPETFNGAKVLFNQMGGGDIANTLGYTAGADYGSWRKGIDLNAWHGTYQSLLEWAGISLPTNPEPPVVEPPIVIPPIQEKVYYTLFAMNVRSGAGTTYPIVTSFVKNTGFRVIKCIKNSDGSVWGQLDTNKFMCLMSAGKLYYTTMTEFVFETPPVIPPPPPPVVEVVTPKGAGLYKLLDDITAGVEPIGPRPYIRHGLPCTVPIFGGDSTFRVPDIWLDYLRKIMSPATFNYVFKPASGWQNGQELYVVRELTFGGNIVEVLSVEGNKAYIKCLTTDSVPPTKLIKPTENNLHTLVQMFSTQYANGKLDMTTDGRFPYTLLMVDNKPTTRAWIDIRNMKKIS